MLPGNRPCYLPPDDAPHTIGADQELGGERFTRGCAQRPSLAGSLYTDHALADVPYAVVSHGAVQQSSGDRSRYRKSHGPCWSFRQSAECSMPCEMPGLVPVTTLRYNCTMQVSTGFLEQTFATMEKPSRGVSAPHLVSCTLGVELPHGQADVLHSEPGPGHLFMLTKVGRPAKCMQTQGPLL